MGEWVHIGVSAVGAILAAFAGIIFHGVRDDIVRLAEQIEKTRDEHSETREELARLKGRCDGLFRQSSDSNYH